MLLDTSTKKKFVLFVRLFQAANHVQMMEYVRIVIKQKDLAPNPMLQESVNVGQVSMKM